MNIHNADRYLDEATPVMTPALPVPPPAPQSQAEPHDTTPPNNPSSDSWFDAQFDIHLGRDDDRY